MSPPSLQETETNRQYQVQYRSALLTDVWSDLGTPVAGQNLRTAITDAPDQAQRCYRVVLLP